MYTNRPGQRQPPEYTIDGAFNRHLVWFRSNFELRGSEFFGLDPQLFKQIEDHHAGLAMLYFIRVVSHYVMDVDCLLPTAPSRECANCMRVQLNTDHTIKREGGLRRLYNAFHKHYLDINGLQIVHSDFKELMKLTCDILLLRIQPHIHCCDVHNAMRICERIHSMTCFQTGLKTQMWSDELEALAARYGYVLDREPEVKHLVRQRGDIVTCPCDS